MGDLGLNLWENILKQIYEIFEIAKLWTLNFNFAVEEAYGVVYTILVQRLSLQQVLILRLRCTSYTFLLPRG